MSQRPNAWNRIVFATGPRWSNGALVPSPPSTLGVRTMHSPARGGVSAFDSSSSRSRGVALRHSSFAFEPAILILYLVETKRHKYKTFPSKCHSLFLTHFSSTTTKYTSKKPYQNSIQTLKMFAQSILFTSLVTIASAANLKILVSDNNSTLLFNPSTTTAKIGDTVTFHFFPKNHNVVQSSFDSPCAPLKEGGFYSGFIPSVTGEANKTFAITVKDDKPIWFYCSQGKHCNSGMAGVINPG